jgi:hypothetical protein
MTSAFLSAVASLGDVNGDLTEEVAFGAPFGSDGRVLVWSTIAPEDTGIPADTDTDTEPPDDTDLPIDTGAPDDTDDDGEDTDDDGGATDDTDSADDGCNCAVSGRVSLTWLAPLLFALTARRRSSTP